MVNDVNQSLKVLRPTAGTAYPAGKLGGTCLPQRVSCIPRSIHLRNDHLIRLPERLGELVHEMLRS